MSKANPPLQPLLQPGETILWEGTPGPGIHFLPQDLFIIPFAILWLAFIASLIVQFRAHIPHDRPESLFIPGWGLLFFALGICAVLGRYGVGMWERATTRYMLTNRRAIMRGGRSVFRGQRERHVDLASLSEITVYRKPDGAGTIVFGPEEPFWIDLRGFPVRMLLAQRLPAFEIIDNVERVHALIEHARRDPGS